MSFDVLQELNQNANPPIPCISITGTQVKHLGEHIWIQKQQINSYYIISFSFEHSNRYFFVRWRLNVANMYVIVGETGDSDHEELIPGTHRTLIMKGVVTKGSEDFIRSAGSYQKDDIVPEDCPQIAHVNENAKAEEIANALKQLANAGN